MCGKQMQDPFGLGDAFGPAKVVYVREPSVGLRGIVVVDNTAAGPALGGLRIAPDVSLTECARLARAMTLKNAAAGLPHGGGKSVLFGDPRMPIATKEVLIRAMACALADCRDYIFGPDMGTDETCMAWVHDEIGRAVGLPLELGGIPLDELGATGFGLAHAAEVAARSIGLDLAGARIAVQGFGSVGQHAARFLAERGARLVAVGDSRGAIASPHGLDLEALRALKAKGESVRAYPDAERLAGDDLLAVDCDVWIPAARPDVIREDCCSRLRARLVVCGANLPITAGAEAVLHGRGVLCVPDFIANAGGVICAAMEYRGAGQAAAFAAIEAKIRANTAAVLAAAERDQVAPQQAAVALAQGRVRRAMELRRWSIF
jgi:glutamate dehydrogenase (NAD(P)+)